MLSVLSLKGVIKEAGWFSKGANMKMNISRTLVGIACLWLLLVNFPTALFAEVSADTNSSFSSVPINLTGNDVAPLVMIDASRDHQLSYKAYNDYSDLNNDGIPETTYTDTIEYYGYFDSAKCYTYDTSDNRFEPAALATGANKHYCSGQWSGNFMNWATMTRMDVVRKLLYGGKRSTDTSTLTVLERHYLPPDAHSFAKYYNGSDIDLLTPFTGIAITPPTAISVTSVSIGSGNKDFTTGLSVNKGDQIRVYSIGNNTRWMVGTVINAGSPIRISVPAGSYNGAGSFSDWRLENLTQTGITLANLTPRGSNRYSDNNVEPPLIRVVRGNFSLWAANERRQCYWSGEESRSNANKAYLSGINANSQNPSQATQGLGRSGSDQGQYIARVEVANSSWLGTEKVKRYGSSYKPIGLLQVYGDEDQIYFGLMTGSYENNVSGGVLRKNVNSFKNEVNSADGTFTGVTGIVYNFNHLRIYGYDYNDGTYIGRDNCTFQQIGIVHSGGTRAGGHPATEGSCSSWGNPMSEIYLESLRYLAGASANPVFTDSVSTGNDADLGLTLANWSDPLNATNYCAPLNVLNFNASMSSYDGDQTDGITDIGTIASPTAAQTITNAIGVYEGIDASSWFVGDNGVVTDNLCSSKNIGSGFGSYSGLCPEAPTQKGTYLISGMAYYANTHRIRTDLTIPTTRANSRDLMVTTYGIALATNVPKIEIASGLHNDKITILPAYRLDRTDVAPLRYGGGTLVDFKILEQTATSGKFYVNWEDSEMGGDYDQDMWGIIEYSISGNQITITTDALAESTGNGQGFGYVISGTTADGAHFHSGIEGFDYTDPQGVTGCNNCQVGDASTSVTYTINGSSAGVLEDPLEYAAKWGGFVDSNNNLLPDQTSEWDAIDNATGAAGSDGIPDNYFYATNPLQLENSLNRVFLAILQRSSSGTAAAVVSNNVSGVGALYQAYYEPLRQDALNNQVSWIGTVQALWLDDYGYLREDDGDAVLEGYFTDKVIQQFYDEVDNKTKIRRYESTDDDKFVPYFMDGTVTAYNSATGVVKFTVTDRGGAVSSGPFSDWTVYNLTNGANGTSSSSASISAVNTAGVTFTVAPLTTNFSVGDGIRVAHFVTTVSSLEEVGTLWNAREQLSFSVASAGIQRTFSNPANDTALGGRFIKTWIDADNDNVVDSGEFINFDRTAINSSNFGFLNVADETEADNLVDYVRGVEISGYRNRTIDYNGDGNTEVVRLADVVNATPTVVGSPQEALDLIYKDSSYGVFKKQYAKRRQVLYVGSNGGMLHAFNGGFYNSETKSFLTTGQKYDGSAATAHPLGAEIWAYVPMNLLPHLKWLKDINYEHVYYVDGKPKVFDAKIFTADADHPNGWGTVLVVGMRFGGGSITVDTAADGLTSDATPADNRTFSSAYVIMDITNPEVEPKLLAEIQVPDGSFSTSYPTAVTVDTNNKWFLLFGSGPTDLGSAESTGTAKLYAIDLDTMTLVRTDDTGIANSFVGDPVAVDWDLNYKADDVYFGIVGGQVGNSGQIMRMDIDEDDDPANWSAPSSLINVSQPVVSSVTPAIDNNSQKWIFFGTGRFYVRGDQTSTATQSIYGIKEDGSSTVLAADLLNVSTAQVETDGDLTTAVGANTTFNSLVNDIDVNYDGWYLNLPPIQGVAGVAPATRVINSSALAGGVLFTTAYQPGLDLCTGEGASRIYGLYYKTGTASPSPNVLGTEIDGNGNEVAKSYLDLGVGFATTPSLHSGTKAGSDKVSVFTQLSTGSIVRTEASTLTNVRSGFKSWIEPR